MSLLQFLLVDCCVGLTVTLVMVTTLSGLIVVSSQPLSPPLLLKLVVGFVRDRPIALRPCFPIAYLFKIDCYIFGADLGKMAGNR